MESEVLVKNELLCYIQNYYDKSPRENMVAAIIGFYSVSEIESAKGLIVDIAKKVVDEGALSGVAKRRTGQNKRKMDVEDILSIYEQLDKSVSSIPTFVAVTLKRIPSVSPSEVDVCALAANVNELQLQMDTMVATLKKLVKGQPDIAVSNKPVHEPKPFADGRPTWAAQVDKEFDTAILGGKGESSQQSAVNISRPDDADAFKLVTYNKQKPMNSTIATKPPLKLIGKRATKDNVKTVSRRLVCFVGRLHKDTTEDHLANYLAESGIHDVKCTLIKPKEGRTFNTAAFRVSCDPQYAAMFYNEESWPDGAELRDWVFY